MKSFKVILVRNFTGMIFITFLIVYFLFNILTNNFITAEANRELAMGAADIEAIASDGRPGAFNFRGGAPLPPGLMDELMLQWRHMRSLNRLMMNADGIIISNYNEVISPNLSLMNDTSVQEILFISYYYVNNRGSFENGAMVRVVGASNTYYLMAVPFLIAEDISYSVLLYTDITSAVAFMRNINQTLGVLLLVSGLLSVLISILMSSQVQRAIVRLCKYAEIIGQGNFNERVEDFDYKEFSALAVSMNNMSNMLNAYENNQKQFFQNVSHELRTPLMSIQGYAEGILEDVLDKKEASEVILSESERMGSLVSQLLYVSRMDSGLDAIDITSFSIKNMLYDSAWRVKILADKSGKEIILNFPEADTKMQSDEEKLQRAIDNILFNCIRHASTKVTVGYTVVGGNIEITISDDGSGIANTDLPHIFERFYKGINGNSGLGLAISKDIAEKLGGSIKADNILGKIDGLPGQPKPRGARFVITMPIFKN